jgi:hypothetical protein
MNHQNASETTARAIAPEDIKVGSYLAVLNIVGEYLPLSCADAAWNRSVELVRVLWLPWGPGPIGSGEPLKVKAVCLPFVLVRTIKGELRTLDVRRYRFAQLNDGYGRKVFKKLKTKSAAPKPPQIV